MKRILVIALFSILVSLSFMTQCHSENTMDLEQLIREALENNPDIAGLRSYKDALWERPSQARAWDDPRLSFGVTNLPTDDFDFNKQDMTQKTVSIMQNIPFPGITALREKSAIEAAKGAEKELGDIKIRLVNAVKKAYYSLYFIYKSIQITQANVDLMENFVELTQSKYEVGKGLQEDILKARVELYKLKERLIDLRQKKTSIRAELNRLLNRSSAGPQISGLPTLPNTEFFLNRPDLEETALAENPRLQALKHAIEQSETEHLLAKKMYFPQFSITAAYGQRDNRINARPFPARVTDAEGTANNVQVLPLSEDRHRPDFFSFLVGINVPLWFKSKQSKKAAENHHRTLQAKAQYQSVKNDILFQINDLSARISKDQDLSRLYEEQIIPEADQSLNADMAAYQVGKIDFLTLLNSQITLFNFEIQYHKVMSDYEKDLAELERMVGKRLF